jgi:two-component system sensor histidine kinase PilS (NtrC family)
VTFGKESIKDEEYKNKLKRLMAFRVIFALLLLGSTFIVHLKRQLSFPISPLLLLYGLIVFIFLCSLAYAVTFNRVKNPIRLAYVQIGLDTFIITILVYLSGGFDSSYSFLYPVVSIYSSILLFQKGSLIISGLASIQYAILIGLEFFNIIPPLVSDWGYSAARYHWSYVTYQVLIVTTACFAVSLLSSYLVEQTRRAKKEVKAMQDHVDRVDKMASLGEMAAGLAHEIKNPLASMAGSIQLLNRETFDNPDHKKLMEIVLREANRLSSLVNNFLLFAKSPEGNRQPVCLTDEIEETLMLIEKDGNCHHQAEFIKDLKPDLWVEMDPVHLRQILWNLLLNAVEAVGEHGRVIIRAIPLRNNLVRVGIDDNGIGIESVDINRIFVPFFSNKPHGTGLGLSIVHNLLEGYHSRLDIDSEPGRGTRVTFELKAAEKKN